MAIETVPMSQAFRGGAGLSGFPRPTSPSTSFMTARTLPKYSVRGGEGMPSWVGIVGVLLILLAAVSSWSVMSFVVQSPQTSSDQGWLVTLFTSTLAFTALLVFSRFMFGITNRLGGFMLDANGFMTTTGVVVHSLVLAGIMIYPTWKLVTQLGASKVLPSS